MTNSVSDVLRAHAALGSVGEIVTQRRALYSALLEVLGGEAPIYDTNDTSLLDSPAVRGHLGAVLSGTSVFSPEVCLPVDQLVGMGHENVVAGAAVRLASASCVRYALSGAVDRITEELGRHGADQASPAFLTEADPAMVIAAERILGGVELAIAVAADLALDLLPHVSAFGVLVRTKEDRLGSASAREYPGLILLPEPDSYIEVAEALIHEGAHQKFFDLATTRCLFADTDVHPPIFFPSWAQASAPAWPFEQAFAAWHAYCCLAAFFAVLDDGAEIPEDSLLPAAADRAEELVSWLKEHGEFLGRDAHLFLTTMGSPPSPGSRHQGDILPIADLAESSWLLRSVGERVLAVRRSAPYEPHWVDMATSMLDERPSASD